MSNKIYFLLIFYVFIINCIADEKCSFSTCHECISSIDDCVWCTQETMVNEGDRCKPSNDLRIQAWCDEKYIQKSETTSNVTDNYDFNATIQLKPQRIKIKARPGIEIPITIYYKPDKDYPLDIYFLMDISFTMKSKTEELRKQAENIYTQLTSYTNNVRLGIGSFIEKPGFPYVDKLKPQYPHKSHSFKHHLSLTTNMSDFASTINSIEFGANYDNPEAGLDGLMQAMTCFDELGWRSGARRIIVLCTDSTYHSAGDGKIVGAIKPNDMKCHLENNLYNDTIALTYDYPSVSQINKVASDGQFIIVFAAIENVKEVYTSLAKHIFGAKYAILEKGTDAVKIIKEAYLENTMKPKLTLNNLPKFLQFNVDQNCSIRNCESTPENRIVEIAGTLKIKYCPEDNSFNREHFVGVGGIEDKVIFDLDIECSCECEKKAGVPHPKCFNDGLLKCGLCECNKGSYGIDCRCNGTSTDTKDDDKCKLTPTDTVLCSNHGNCLCGKCDTCDHYFSGDHCEYDDRYDCPKKDKKLCSDHGSCTRGQCKCDKNWGGEDCGCTLRTDICTAPHSKEVCSGNGNCECGKCKCNKLPDKDGIYLGSYCDECDDCAEKRCKDLQDYVHCNVINNKELCDEQYNAKDTVVKFKNKTELNVPEWNMAQLCKIHLDNDSLIIFKYKYDDRNIVLGIQNELELPPEVDLLLAVGSAVGSVLLIGIVTLIVWKILVDLHDKREYEKFAQESQAQGYDVTFNPLFVEAEVAFTNPTFERR